MLTLKKSVLSLAVRRFCNTRSFLTDSYKCNEVWQERLSCPLLMKVEHEVLYYKLSSMLANDTKQISAIDLDIFANSLTDKIFLDELEDLTHKFRLSAQAGTLLPSTHHAVVRFYLESGNKSDLVRILRDRLNYGIFTDYYLSNLLMDTFLKENDFQNSVVIASNQMLQEELDNEITKTMGSYSCLKYVTDSINEKEIPVDVQEKNNEKEEEEDDEEEEVKRVRVDFLRNPYFDDHFDLTDNDHLAGKTLLAISKTNNTILGNSLKAIGLAYYNKWNELGSLLDKSESPVYLETVDLAVAAIDKRAPENSEKLKNALTKLKVENKSLTEETKNALMEAINKNEEKEIQIQKQVYKEWESVRREELNKCVERLNKMKRLQKVQEAKQNLKKKEELLFFFDNEHKHDLVNEEKSKRMKKVVAKAKSPKDDLLYIPPEIRKPGFKRE